MDRTGVGWWYPTESRMGSFHSISGMELEEHGPVKTSVTHRLLHISKNSKKLPPWMHGWMFDDWVMGLREDPLLSVPPPTSFRGRELISPLSIKPPSPALIILH